MSQVYTIILGLLVATTSFSKRLYTCSDSKDWGNPQAVLFTQKLKTASHDVANYLNELLQPFSNRTHIIRASDEFLLLIQNTQILLEFLWCSSRCKEKLLILDKQKYFKNMFCKNLLSSIAQFYATSILID